MIQVEHLSKKFGKQVAVQDVSFHVRRGEVVGLLGPNGAGKSTTMRILVGFLASDSGQVKIDGQVMSRDHVELRRLIGYLPENAPVYHDSEVVEYLHYIGELRGIPKTQLAESVRKVVQQCGLQAVVGRDIGKLSKGYRQRVGLAQALIHQPKILILDEPSSGLDPNQIVEMRELIKSIGQERTVILSTHILKEVEASCGRALIMHRGCLVSELLMSELQQQHTSLESVFRELTAS